MRIFCAILILFGNTLYSQDILRIDDSISTISYSGKHFLHSWDAVNENISGLIEVNDNQVSKIGVVAKVTDFKSGNSSLDSNSYRVLDALRVPNIIFTSSEIDDFSDNIKILGIISFHGVEKKISVSLKKISENDIISFTGEFLINLSDYNVKRPSLLLQKINDQIEIDLNLVFN